ncbi:hypothetical protein D3C75_949960 [compost metagenome]
MLFQQALDPVAVQPLGQKPLQAGFFPKGQHTGGVRRKDSRSELGQSPRFQAVPLHTMADHGADKCSILLKTGTGKQTRGQSRRSGKLPAKLPQKPQPLPADVV